MQWRVGDGDGDMVMGVNVVRSFVHGYIFHLGKLFLFWYSILYSFYLFIYFYPLFLSALGDLFFFFIIAINLAWLGNLKRGEGGEKKRGRLKLYFTLAFFVIIYFIIIFFYLFYLGKWGRRSRREGGLDIF